MTPTNQNQRYMIDRARKDARSPRQDWPGTPLSHLPVSAKADLDALVSSGLIRIVERPSARDPRQNVAYMVAQTT